MSKWIKFASCNKFSPVDGPVQVALAFLTWLVREWKSFNQICMARSVLWSVINQQQSFGNIPIVKRYMKGIFESNPTLPKFQFTWNVSLLFNYFRNMQDIHALDIQKLTQKLVMLMALISGGQRAQTIHSIRVSGIKILDNKVVIPIICQYQEIGISIHSYTSHSSRAVASSYAKSLGASVYRVLIVKELHC